MVRTYRTYDQITNQKAPAPIGQTFVRDLREMSY